MSKKDKNRQSKTCPERSRGIVNRKSHRLPISAVRVKNLAYTSSNLTAAEALAGLSISLGGIIENYPKLKKAWQRGQFLRNLEALAGVVETVSEAARKLELPSGQVLRDMIDSDREVGDLWNQTRLNTRIEARKSLIEAAREGNQAAIRAVENYLRDDQKSRAAGADTTRLMQKQVAELFEVTRITVKDWTDRHGCPRNADGSYDLKNVIRWWQDYNRRKSGTHVAPSDRLRDLKAEEKKLDLLERQHKLLDREQVIAGLVARYQNMVAAFNYKRRELANMLHNQTIEGIEDILGRFFEDLQRQQLEVPEFLEIRPEAAEKLRECLILATKGTENAEKA